ncbi:MAG: mechanosensitive ion channel family protein [Lachnospiraceae bacterium]|nr:mechanosensitive ion channel family protein [Lachnospiraceae bacterium]
MISFLDLYETSSLFSVVMNFLMKLITAAVTYGVGTKLIKFVRKQLRKLLERHNAEKGVITFLDSAANIGLYVILVFTILEMFGFDTASLLAVIASASVAIGLALQGAFTNLAGGVLILFQKPFQVGDYIIAHGAGLEGTVDDIQIFYTHLHTADNKIVVIPNGTVSDNSITNVTKGANRRVDVAVSIAYDADLKKAKDVLMKMLEADEATLKEEPMIVAVTELADSGVNLTVRSWVKGEDYWESFWRLTEKTKLTLDENGISIPFPQMDVHMIPMDSRTAASAALPQEGKKHAKKVKQEV